MDSIPKARGSVCAQDSEGFRIKSRAYHLLDNDFDQVLQGTPVFSFMK